MGTGTPHIHKELLKLVDAWKAPQLGLESVVRWKKYVTGGNVRVQNSLEHSLSITILDAIMIDRFDPYIQERTIPGSPLDKGLILTALAIHDIGEGEIGRDTHYIDKTEAGDLEEYNAFYNRYSQLPGKSFSLLHKAFLLQFVLKDIQIFPADTRRILENMGRLHLYDALAFDAIERWDYFLYAFEQYKERGNRKILVQTLRNQIGHFERLAEKMPGFKETVWTEEWSSWANAFLKEYEGKWIEQKGEVVSSAV